MNSRSLEIIEEYLNYIEIQKAYSLNTKIKYEHVFLVFNEYLISINKTLLNAEYKDVKNFIRGLYDMEYTYTTLANYISALKSLYKYLVDKNYVPVNIMTNIGYPKKQERLFKIIYSKELKDFFKTIDKYSKYPNRDRSLFLLLYSTGIRVFECSNLKLENIEFSKKVVKVYGKGKKERIIPLKEEMIIALEKYIAAEREILRAEKVTDYLFLNKYGEQLTDRGIRYLTTKYCNKSSENMKVSPHTFRHTLATNLLNSGMDLRSIQIILGHESLSTTEKYTHISKDELKKKYMTLLED